MAKSAPTTPEPNLDDDRPAPQPGQVFSPVSGQSTNSSFSPNKSGQTQTPLQGAKSTYDKPGNAPSSKNPSPELEEKEEAAGKSGSPKTKDNQRKETPEDLDQKEKNAGEDNQDNDSFYHPSSSREHPDTVGRGYNPDGKVEKPRSGIGGRRRALFGGGGLAVAVTAIVMFFTLSSGPFQFIHIGQLLQQGPLATLSNQQDNRFMQEVRYWRYVKNGEIEKTRLGYLGNVVGNNFETQLNNNGLKSVYSDKFGRFNGYLIDTTDPNSPFYGEQKDPKALAAAVKQDTGLDIVQASEIQGVSGEIPSDSWMIRGDKLGYLKSLKLNYLLLNAAGKNKLASAIGARLMCTRNACTGFLHPMTKLALKTQASIEEWLKTTQTEEQKGATGDVESAAAADESGTTQESTDERAAADSVNKIVADENDPVKLRLDIRNTALGGAAGIGLICMAYSVNNRVGDLKQAQVIAPLIRMGTLMLGMGSQFMSGQDVDLDEAGSLSQQLHGKDSNGNVTGWDQAAAFGGTVTANTTLTGIGSATGPFDNLISAINHASPIGLGKVCSGAGQIITGAGQIVFDFATGGAGTIEGFIVNAVGGSILGAEIETQLVNWLSGHAVDVAAVGADFGNEINYGAALGANDQAIGAGGTAMSQATATALDQANYDFYQNQFDSKNIGYKLFNPYDNRSTISKLINNSSPNLSQNLNSVGSMFLNVRHMLSSVASIFGSKVHAVNNFSYGFPAYGFTPEEMDSIPNPYQNAQEVADLFNSTGGKDSNYVDKAKKCFGVTIAQDSSNLWSVTSGEGDSPKVYGNKSYDDFNCGDSSDPNWLKVRMFIMDTEVINSMSCYGGDDQACSDIGFANSASGTDNNGSVSTGPSSATAGAQIVGNIGESSDKLACAANTKDVGVVTSQYTGSVKVGSGPLQIRLCQLTSIGGSGNNTSGAQISRGAVVNSRVSGAWEALGEAATKSGVNLSANSSFRLGDSCGGGGDGGACATPGTSMHQLGVAIDFATITVEGGSTTDCSSRARQPGNASWDWLNRYAAQYGFKQYSFEAWHWDPLGGPNRCGGDGT